MQYGVVIMSTSEIEFTPNAARKVTSLKQEEGNDALKLRVYITGN